MVGYNQRGKIKMNKEQLVNLMVENLDKDTYQELPPITENGEYWTIADLFIRQYLNNGDNGFGLKNVSYIYTILRNNKDLLVSEKMVAVDGFNNFGLELWKDYNF
jgi:hypothetical protein